MKKFLEDFSGKPLDKKLAITGMHLCFKNAESLLSDAKVLRENNRFARALSLTVLSIEEIGKIPILLNTIYYSKKDDKKWKIFWKAFTSHKHKQNISSNYGKYILKKFGKEYKSSIPSGATDLINKIKQLGLYVSFFRNQFILPDNFAQDNLEWLDFLIKFADERLESLKPLHGTLESSDKFVKKGDNFFKLFGRCLLDEKISSVEELEKKWMY